MSQEECKRASQILLDVIREDVISVTGCSVQNDGFKSLITKLQSGNLVHIEVLPDIEDNAIRIVGVDEDIAHATKKIFNFIKEVGMRSDTYRPESSEQVWNFLAGRVNHQSVMQIAKDLEEYSVSIQITDDKEQFHIRGYNEGVEQCKQRLSQMAEMVVEEKKRLEYPGIKRLLLSQAGMEHLQMIKNEVDVEIEVVKSPKSFPRTYSMPAQRFEMFAYDLCNFTTNEGITVSWKYGIIEDEEVSG